MGEQFINHQAGTLKTAAKDSANAGNDLGRMVKNLGKAAAVLEKSFEGEGAAAFRNLKKKADGLALRLNKNLGQINNAQTGMNNAVHAGDAEWRDNAARQEKAAAPKRTYQA